VIDIPDNAYPRGRGRGKGKPLLSYDELKVQIALGTIPPEYIRDQVYDPEILDNLANLPDDNVRKAVAAHPNVRLDTLMRLVEDSSTPPSLLILIAAHPKMSVEGLHKIATHKNPMVSEEAKGVLFIRSKGSIDIQDN